jgi:hypothetical protein
MTTPYVPNFGPPTQLRALYNSRVQVSRLVPTLTTTGGMSLAWSPLTSVLDPTEDVSGYMSCRLDIGFIRPGKDTFAPLVAGRAPDRVGVAYYDPAVDANGVPLVLAGDRLLCVSGPIFGTFEIRIVPEVAQNFSGAHHIEVQVIEVAKQTQAGSFTPFPGGKP